MCRPLLHWLFYSSRDGKEPQQGFWGPGLGTKGQLAMSSPRSTTAGRATAMMARPLLNHQVSRALPDPHLDPQQSRLTRMVLLWWDYLSEGSHCGTRESGRGIHLFPWVFLMFQLVTWHPKYVTAVSWPLSDDGITSNLSWPFFIVYLTIYGCSHTQL